MRSLLSLGLLACLLSACAAGVGLVPASNLYLSAIDFPAEQIPQNLRTTDPEIFYVTDRLREGSGYGSGRSQSMAFGVAQVEFGKNQTWQQLLTRTREISGKRTEPPTVLNTNEIVRFNATPLPLSAAVGS